MQFELKMNVKLVDLIRKNDYSNIEIPTIVANEIEKTDFLNFHLILPPDHRFLFFRLYPSFLLYLEKISQHIFDNNKRQIAIYFKKMINDRPNYSISYYNINHIGFFINTNEFNLSYDYFQALSKQFSTDSFEKTDNHYQNTFNQVFQLLHHNFNKVDVYLLLNKQISASNISSELSGCKSAINHILGNLILSLNPSEDIPLLYDDILELVSVLNWPSFIPPITLTINKNKHCHSKDKETKTNQLQTLLSEFTNKYSFTIFKP